MCRLDTAGDKYGCGHYIMTREIGKEDCGQPRCRQSSRHIKARHNCDDCAKHYLPDRTETVEHVYRDTYCHSCKWYKDKANAQPR